MLLVKTRETLSEKRSKKKDKEMDSEKYISTTLGFAKYLSYSEVQKNSKVVNV